MILIREATERDVSRALRREKTKRNRQLTEAQLRLLPVLFYRARASYCTVVPICGC